MENATITTLTAQFPLVEDLIALKETTWLNPRTTLAEGLPYVGLTKADVDDAHARLNRFAPYLAKAFRKRRRPMASSNLNWLPFRQCKNGWKICYKHSWHPAAEKRQPSADLWLHQSARHL
jgi:D-serine dehydratase